MIGKNELQTIMCMMRNWANSNLDPIPLDKPKGLGVIFVALM
jgi:hypothetical protein